MNSISFFVFGNPVSQGRARIARMGNCVRMYDPEKSKSWKESIRWQAIENKISMFTGAIVLGLTFYLPRPKSLPKKVIHHTKKPDLDNLIKAVKDALKGITWKDDSQVVKIIALKLYAVEKTGVRIEIMENL